MGAKEAERPFLEKVTEYLISLPFDLKVLQEAVTDPDLEHAVREIAAGTIIHTISPQTEGEGPLKFADDVLFVRAALAYVVADGSEGSLAFKNRFAGEIYERLGADCSLFQEYLGDLWPWLEGRLVSFGKIPYKGKKPTQYVDDEEAATLLYEEGLEFQTNYNLNEEQIRNKVRRADQILELLNKKRAEEAKKKA
jgi:hypothetical protein